MAFDGLKAAEPQAAQGEGRIMGEARWSMSRIFTGVDERREEYIRNVVKGVFSVFDSRKRCSPFS